MNESETLEDHLARKFPEMRPVRSSPALFTLNGFGLSMAGRRDLDHETGTYVKSHVITALFIPIYTLGSYRVADAENGGWYFLGKVEKGTFAKVWNTAVVTSIVLGIALIFWNVRTSSPEYRAQESLELAAAHSEAGEHLQAAAVYRGMILDGLPAEAEARAGLSRALSVALESGSAAEVSEALAFLRKLTGAYFVELKNSHEFDPLILGALARFETSDPEGAIKITREARSLLKDPESLATTRERILSELVKGESPAVEYVVELAVLREQQGNAEEARALLEPHVEALGDSEGSRILGQLFLAEGRAAEAAPLLARYIEPRLEKWRSAEKRYAAAAERAYNKVIEELNRGDGPQSFFDAYEKAGSEEEQGRLVDEYVYGQMQRNPDYVRAGRKYEEAGAIVPLVMELGVSELRAAQSSSDPDERSALLQRAEDRFLSMKDAAGESEEYKFLLGQVYYWSGKQDEGRRLFDSLLATSGRSFGVLTGLSDVMREIGNTEEARSLAEEAFESATTDEERDAAAGQRAFLFKDLDDQISWLQRVTTKGVYQTTRLANALGNKAHSEGDLEEAIKQFEIADDGWAKLPTSASGLNNGALVKFSLFALTGKVSEYEAGSRMMARAVALEPENSILLGNAASSLVGTAIMQVLEGRLHPRIIQAGVGLDELRFFYRNEEERSVLINTLQDNANYREGMELYDRALLLSPNQRDLYGTIAGLRGYVYDTEAVRQLVDRASAARFEEAEARESFAKLMSGESDQDLEEGLQSALKQIEDMRSGIDEAEQRVFLEVAAAELKLARFKKADPPAFSDEVNALQAAFESAPSARSQAALVQARNQEACVVLAGESADFAALFESCHRYTGASEILAMGLTSGKLRPLLVKHPVAREAMLAELEFDRLYPTNRNVSAVIIAEHLAPELHTEARSQYLSSELTQLNFQIAGIMNSWHPSMVVAEYLHLMAEGQPGKAREVLRNGQAASEHVPVLE